VARNNAAKNALASLQGGKGKGKGGKGKPPAKKAAAKPVAKKAAAPKKAAAKPAARPKAVAAAAVTKPAADVFKLVHQCWTLYKGDPDNQAAALEAFPVAGPIVVGYGHGLCIPTAKAAEKLEEFRRWLADEPAPAPAAVAQPWEPVPPAVARLLAGEVEGRAAWIVGGSLYEFETGWDQPRRKDTTAPEDWNAAGVVKPLTPAAAAAPTVDDVPPAAAADPGDPQNEPAGSAFDDAAAPTPEPADDGRDPLDVSDATESGTEAMTK
jgi:hypothetical protein